MIVTITLNPALDKSTSVAGLVPEKKMRCTAVRTDPGGGGINVSKAIRKLGGKSMAVFPSGGSHGKQIEELLRAEGIDILPIIVDGNTRENFSILDTTTGSQYRFVMPGAAMGEDQFDACLNAVSMLKPKPDIIVASGSLPEGAPDDIFSSIASLARRMNAKLIVDTSGPALKKAMEAGVFLLKPNLGELSSLAGLEHLQLHDVEQAAREIISKGYCQVMVVSLGAGGALMVTEEELVHVPAPTVRKLSTVGAGDSMVGGMAWKLEQGASFADMVRFGVACGTAATMNAGTQLFHREDALKLYTWLKSSK